MQEVENQIPANSSSIAVELTTGEHISSERCSRWLDVRTQEWRYQVEIGGRQFLGKMNDDGKIALSLTFIVTMYKMIPV